MARCAPRCATVAWACLLLTLTITGTALATADDLDSQSPLPPSEPKRLILAEKFRVPNSQSRIFKGTRDPKSGVVLPNTGIVDFEPVAAETRNADEYTAWNDVILHARQFTAVDLEANASRDLVRDDLLGAPRFLYRLDLVHFAGKLTKARRLAATQALQQAGVAEVYEGLLAPLCEPPGDVLSVIFTELPEALATVRLQPVGSWLEVNLPATAAGYFFKVNQDGIGEPPVPIIIGKSITVQNELPPVPDTKLTALDKGLRIFQFIKDDAFAPKGEENWAEATAWNRVLLHARRFTAEELEANARTDVKFADLFLDGRRDYKLELVKIEGRLLLLRKIEPSKKLRDAGLQTAYEGWIVPRDEPRGNPICVVFTDLPEGVEPEGRVNKWVTFAGFAFKLLRYKSGEQDKTDPNDTVTKRAPLLLGRTITIRPDPEAVATVSWKGFVQTITLVVLGLLGAALGLTLWFRRGDRKAKQEVQTHRAKNPFVEPAN